MRVIALGAALLLALTACGADATSSASEPSAFDGEWRYVSGNGPKGDIPSKPDRISLFLESGRIHGSAACNLYDGTTEIGDATIHITELAWTAMGCRGRAMATDTAYDDALEAVNEIRREGNELTLEEADVELVFAFVEPEPDAPLAETRWRFNGTITGRGPNAPVGFSSAGKLMLSEDGTLSGSTGCRAFSGRWRDAEDHIEVTEFETRGQCDGDESQDAHIVSVLREGFTTSIEGDSMEIYHLSEDLGLVYKAD